MGFLISVGKNTDNNMNMFVINDHLEKDKLMECLLFKLFVYFIQETNEI